MVKSYIIAGSLLLTSLAIVGGISFNSSDRNLTPNNDRASGGYVERLFGNSNIDRSNTSQMANAGPGQSLYRFFTAADPVPETGQNEAGLVPLPYWLLQKLLSEGEVTTTPAPCPVWMLYKLGISEMS